MKINSCPICGHTPIIDVTKFDLEKIHCSNIRCPLTREVPIFTIDVSFQVDHSKEEIYEYLSDIWNEETVKINELILHRHIEGNAWQKVE